MRASHLTRRALAAGAFLLAAGGLWACDGGSVLDPEAAPPVQSTAGDTIPGDTIPPDTLPGDTTGNPGGGQRTAQLVISVGAQAQDTAAVMGVGPAVYRVTRGNGNQVVLVDSTTAWGFDSEQLSPGNYTVQLLAYPGIYQLAPGETGQRSVVLTPNSQTSIGFLLERKP